MIWLRLRGGKRDPAWPYAKGWADGCECALMTILGKSTHGQAIYDGPLPDELRDFIAVALSRLEHVRSEDSLTDSFTPPNVGGSAS